MLQVADAVGGGAGHHQRAAAGGVGVADAAAGAGLGAGEGRDAGGEVVGLGGEEDVVVEVGGDERRRARPGRAGRIVRDRVAADGARVVVEGDDAVVGVGLAGAPDDGDEVVGHAPRRR